MEDSVIVEDSADLQAAESKPRGDKSHLIVWQVMQG